MKKILLPVAMFAFVSFIGCNESDKTLDNHICQAFYDTVSQSGKQITADLSSKPELTEEHKTYALSLSGDGMFTINADRTGTLILGTTNAEPEFELSVNGTVVAPMNDHDCNIHLYPWTVTAGDSVSVRIRTDAENVLLVYGIDD